MTAIPLARYLTEFLPGDRADARSAAVNAAGASDAAIRQREATEAAVAASYARGLEEARDLANAEWEAKLLAQQVEFEHRLAAERQEWADQEGSRLAEQLSAGLRSLETGVAQITGSILKPFLVEKLRQRAIADLAVALKAALSHDTEVKLEISGPGDLLERLGEALQTETGAVAFTPNEGCDVRAVIDHTLFETRLAEWLAKVEEAAA